MQHCYEQSVSTAEQLQLIREELVDCTSKEEGESFSRDHLGRIADRLAKIQKEMEEFLITPLKEVCGVMYNCNTFPGEKSADMPHSRFS